MVLEGVHRLYPDPGHRSLDFDPLFVPALFLWDWSQDSREKSRPARSLDVQGIGPVGGVGDQDERNSVRTWQ